MTTTIHYFFKTNLSRIEGLVAVLDEMRSGEWGEVQIGAMDVELASLLGFFVRARDADQVQAFIWKIEKRMDKQDIAYAGKPWSAAR